MSRSRGMLPALVAAALSLACGLLHAQPAGTERESVNTVPITYVGSNGRIGLGLDRDGDFTGDFLAVFGDDGRQAWLAEGWYGQGGAAGLKLGRHWLWGGRSAQDAIDSPDQLTVSKAFLAVDRNVMGDRKASLGFGFERERWFGHAYLSQGLTDERLVDTRSVAATSTLTGTTPAGRPFTQQRTVTTVTRAFEQAYDHGVGARFGRYFEDAALRLQGGLDREWGDYSSHQNTLSLGVEKFIPGSGHSFALNLEGLRRAGDFVQDRSDSRAWLLWRYDFSGAGAWREVQPMREIEQVIEVQVPGEPVLVRNEVGMEAAAFFRLDRFSLLANDEAELARLVQAIASDTRVSRVEIVGHTCDLGREAYNQGLSERRARAVAEFLIARGVDAAELDVRGEGELKPRFANDGEDNRARNRRVDVSFLSVEERSEQGPPRTEQRVEWRREAVPVPAAWIERALRNPAAHKRTVDVYRFETVEQSEQLGPQQLINRPPLAVDDVVEVPAGAVAFPIAVLANDSDPDGDALAIVSITPPANGSAEIAGSRVLYTPRAGFAGTDSFGYTVSDGEFSASAQVRITVAAPPVAQPDQASTVFGVPVSVNLLANDSDPAGLALSLVSVSEPVRGSVEFSADGSVRYTPGGGAEGYTEVLEYRIRNARGAEAGSTLTILVAAALPPVAVPDEATTVGIQPVLIDVLANDFDPQGLAISIDSVGTPFRGRATIEDGRVRYQPDDNWCGTDRFVYTIRNAAGLTASSTVLVRRVSAAGAGSAEAKSCPID
ncbi:MAG: Ig-like domain-containing protein [Aquimonas sp.]|nr:Ig-like domain-containing protein [Aquimonas sp.]